MVAMVTDNTFYSEARPVEEVAGLRQHRGITVRSTILSTRVTTSSPDATSKRACRSRAKSYYGRSSFSRQENPSVCCRDLKIRDQLPSLFNSASCDDTSSSYDGLCYSNCHNLGSSLSLLIRPRLSSRCSLHRTRPTSLMSFGWLFITVLLLTSLAGCNGGSPTKIPLTRTDATRLCGFRTFTGRGPVSAPGSSRSLLTRSSVPQEQARPLDFQTLKVIKRWGATSDVLLVSGRDYVYMINASSSDTDGEISYMERLQWESTSLSRSSCQQMGGQKHECNNFIRVVELQDDGQLFVCGTNSYSPVCRYYSRSQFADRRTNRNTEFSNEVACRGQCACPYNPASSSTTLYTNTTNGPQLFAALVKDYRGKNPVLIRTGDTYIYSIDKWLKDPTFIKLVESKDGKVYLFFRETATSVETGTSLPTTYARVAQVCKNDTGGTTVLRFQWTTFLKARLKCSIPGSAHGQDFTFNNLTSVSEVTEILGQDGRPMDVIFATFTTPWDWEAVSMSAVCVYPMRTIQNLFEVGNFLGEQELRSNPIDTGPFDSHTVETIVKAIPVPDYDVPSPRPGRCPGQGTPMTDGTLAFAKTHSLMFDPVLPLYEQPMFVSETDIRATQIAVDSNAGYGNFMVVYVGTEDGKILRLRPRLHTLTGPKSMFLEEMRVADVTKCDLGSIACGVRALHISRPTLSSGASARLDVTPKPSTFIAFTDRMTQVPLTSCAHYANRYCCSADPECGWHNSECVIRTRQNNASLHQTSDLSSVPTNCQASAVTEQESGRNNGPSGGCPPKRKHTRRLNGAQLRTVVPSGSASRSNTQVNDQPDRGDRCADQTTPGKPHSGATDSDVTAFLSKRFLPSIDKEFQRTLKSLRPEQRAMLKDQLEEALMLTTKLIMRNHKNEHCLPSHSVNSLTHTYPLIMREVEKLHDTAIKKMTEKGLLRSCWDSDRASPCKLRISFSVPFAPTLWDALAHLMMDFRAECNSEPTATDARPEGFSTLPGVLPCKGEGRSRSPHCQPKHCKFNYTVDVKAFFRHADNSRKFLAASQGSEPLWKPVNITISEDEAIKGHLALVVNQNQPFHVKYNPIDEKIKIMFYYAAMRDCNLNDRGCCNRSQEALVNNWFNAVMTDLRPKVNKCERQVGKAEKENRVSTNHQVRPRRSYSQQNNELLQPIPSRCRYNNRKVSRVSNEMWVQIVQRAQDRGGIYTEDHERIEFHSREDIKQFFDNRCSMTRRGDQHENLGRIVRKRRSGTTVSVQILASSRMPFVIEKQNSNRVKIKYFSHIPNKVDGIGCNHNYRHLS